MKKTSLILFLFLCISLRTNAQTVPDSCKLAFGTNMGGLSDYSTELPFVDLMHSCRTWYTKDANNPNAGFDSEKADKLTYRPDGYPTHIPQTIANISFSQKVATIWAGTNGWQAGKYVVLFDGQGTLSFSGGLTNLTATSANRFSFDFDTPQDNMLEMVIETSLASNPVRNIRVLMPNTENTYLTQPFNPIWLNKLLIFKSIRFMDWGQTNHWGQKNEYDWDSPTLFGWNERQKMDYYTWANPKGIPYEMMIKLLNDYNLDGWVCVPHRASNDYIQGMAQLFYTTLKSERKLTVEYSNEVWNWMFGQANWCNKYGNIATGKDWPECIVPYIQNNFNIWTSVYGNNVNRINRTVGVQTAWQDVSNRIVHNLTKNTFDSFAPAFYFGLTDEQDEIALDNLGANAKASDIAYYARRAWVNNEKKWMQEQKKQIADSLNIPMVFYEGGQHLTPTPFGEEPTYAQALLDIQRDTALFNLYNEWFDFVRTLQKGSKPLQCMSFGFVGERSARYGSWGILETMQQDIEAINAPKYKAMKKNIKNCINIIPFENTGNYHNFVIFPNPTCDEIHIKNLSNMNISQIEIVSIEGKKIITKQIETQNLTLQFKDYASGVYLLNIILKDNTKIVFKVVKQ